jgi:calcium-dependent protein kinase
VQALEHPWLATLDSECESSFGDADSDSGGALLDTVVQRLQRFGTYGRLKQVALRGVANVALTVAGNSDMLVEIRSAFAAMDKDGDGRVPYAAMVDYLKRGDFDLSDTETEVLISQMDIDQEGFIRYDEWLTAMLEWRPLQESPEWEAWVREAFSAFDVDGSGRIGAAALRGMLCRDGVCSMPDVVNSALRCASAAPQAQRSGRDDTGSDRACVRAAVRARCMRSVLGGAVWQPSRPADC